MHRKSARRSSLFLFELMISILMFSVASAWCVRLFVAARSVVKETEQQNHVQNMAAGYAELFLSAEDFDRCLLNEGAEKEETAQGVLYRFWYDADWKICSEGEAVFCFEAAVEKNGNFEKCSFSYRVTEEGDTRYLLDVDRYTGGEAAL